MELAGPEERVLPDATTIPVVVVRRKQHPAKETADPAMRADWRVLRQPSPENAEDPEMDPPLPESISVPHVVAAVAKGVTGRPWGNHSRYWEAEAFQEASLSRSAEILSVGASIYEGQASCTTPQSASGSSGTPFDYCETSNGIIVPPPSIRCDTGSAKKSPALPQALAHGPRQGIELATDYWTHNSHGEAIPCVEPSTRQDAPLHNKENGLSSSASNHAQYLPDRSSDGCHVPRHDVAAPPRPPSRNASSASNCSTISMRRFRDMAEMRQSQDIGLNGDKLSPTMDADDEALTRVALLALRALAAQELTPEAGNQGDMEAEPLIGSRDRSCSSRGNTPTEFMLQQRVLTRVDNCLARGCNDIAARWLWQDDNLPLGRTAQLLEEVSLASSYCQRLLQKVVSRLSRRGCAGEGAPVGGSAPP